jgi:hypothetical protein
VIKPEFLFQLLMRLFANTSCLDADVVAACVKESSIRAVVRPTAVAHRKADRSSSISFVSAGRHFHRPMSVWSSRRP